MHKQRNYRSQASRVQSSYLHWRRWWIQPEAAHLHSSRQLYKQQTSIHTPSSHVDKLFLSSRNYTTSGRQVMRAYLFWPCDMCIEHCVVIAGTLCRRAWALEFVTILPAVVPCDPSSAYVSTIHVPQMSRWLSARLAVVWSYRTPVLPLA